MKQHTLTFRCSLNQLERMNRALNSGTAANRTELIAQALTEFLALTATPAVQQMDLFQLVRYIDSTGSAHSFRHEA